MTKTNIILGTIVLLLGAIAVTMVVAPDFADRLRGSAAENIRPIKKQISQKQAQEKVVKEINQVRKNPESFARKIAASSEDDVLPNEQINTAEIDQNFNVKNANLTIKTEDFKNWRVECAENKEGQTMCNMFQRLMWEGEKFGALLVTVVIAESEGAKRPRMTLVAPLGTFLPGGLTLQIEGEKEFTVPFQFCAPNGCLVNLDLAEEVSEKLKKSNNLNVAYRRADGKVAKLQVSLTGFTKALETITAKTSL